jgi:hypothetical protein
MPTSAMNMLRQLCAIDFRISTYDAKIDLYGMINFNAHDVSAAGMNARFGLSGCSLLVKMSSGQMPLRFQLAQLSIEPVGEPEHSVRLTLCGDDQFPAWKLKSPDEVRPMIATLREEMFGSIVNFVPPTNVVVELKPAIQHLNVHVSGDAKPHRMKAIQELLKAEFEYLINSSGPIASQSFEYISNQKIA